eukprot:CAMPEP_0114616468 /NCGR_PEP_ID=MMETSP0168-20121206/6702_1 /TAXON_ID=95228 ORGANISM="Vannella sp., Strain DIVA3 517/6/12" /NCGR_SAMPLE_ID=MMETSP0168 /ASSEMBLY_ACC=CAM_ASM_000044 /LENGTH=284 /DNA_ID=CAMNT_0001827583 /DNA_START=78 /DNA_END=929 /DNA_ORIENTATION=-
MDAARILKSFAGVSPEQQQQWPRMLEEQEEAAVQGLAELGDGYTKFELSVTDLPTRVRKCLNPQFLQGLRKAKAQQRARGQVPWKGSCLHVGIAYDCHVGKKLRARNSRSGRRPNCDAARPAAALRKAGGRGGALLIVPQAVRPGQLLEERRREEEWRRTLELQRQHEAEALLLQQEQEKLYRSQMLQEQLAQAHRARLLHDQHMAQQVRAQQLRTEQLRSQRMQEQHQVQQQQAWGSGPLSPPRLPPPPPQARYPLSPPGFAHLLHPVMHQHTARPPAAASAA